MKLGLKPKHLHIIVPLAGALGLLLRIWTMGNGPDRLGLYQPQPVAWTLLWIVTALTLGLIAACVWKLRAPGQYQDHFPPSVPGAVGCGAAAIGLAFSGFQAQGQPGMLFSVLMNGLALAAAVAMAMGAYQRYHGGKGTFWGFFLSCVYLAFRAFERCRGWNNEPQAGVFAMELLASLSLLMAFYHLAGASADFTSRRGNLIWSFTSAFFCIVAMPGSSEPVFYLCMALCLLTNHCALYPLYSTNEAQEDPLPEEPAQEQEENLQ